MKDQFDIRQPLLKTAQTLEVNNGSEEMITEKESNVKNKENGTDGALWL